MPKRRTPIWTHPRDLPLTVRDREVIALVAQGLTDKAIAVRMGIVKRTASNHVWRVKQKLGLSARVELGVWWARQ